MNAGEYRHRIRIEKPTRGDPDSYGQRAETWSKLADVWAKVEPLGSRELFAAQAAQSKATYRVTTREYVRNLTTECRVIFGTKTLGIESASDPDGRQIQWVLLCAEHE